MPYCPGCGVEVESVVKHCPLCRQEIPVLEEIDVNGGGGFEATFPVSSNIYDKQLRRVKNQIFFSVTLVIISALFSLGFLRSFLDMQSLSIHYSIVGVACAWFYTLLILGYLPNVTYSIVGVGIVSAVLASGIDLVDGHVTWAWSLAVPLIIVGVLILAVVIKVYRRFKHKNQYVVIPIYICTCVSLFCPAIEAILNYRLRGVVELSWSVVVLIPLMTIAAVLLGLYLKLPERMRRKISKKLHI